MREERLKPCPFCGEEAEIERRGTRRCTTLYSCTYCGCFLETGEEWGYGGRWNERPLENELREALISYRTLLVKTAKEDGLVLKLTELDGKYAKLFLTDQP